MMLQHYKEFPTGRRPVFPFSFLLLPLQLRDLEAFHQTVTCPINIYINCFQILPHINTSITLQEKCIGIDACLSSSNSVVLVLVNDL